MHLKMTPKSGYPSLSESHSLSESSFQLESIQAESSPVMRVHKDNESSAGPKKAIHRRSLTMFMNSMTRSYSTSRRVPYQEPKEEPASDLPPLVLGDKDTIQMVKCFQEVSESGALLLYAVHAQCVLLCTNCVGVLMCGVPSLHAIYHFLLGAEKSHRACQWQWDFNE